MAITYLSGNMRQIQPRVELRKQDRRPGAYPTKAKTGDKTRTGRNKVFFDDARTVLFLTGVNVTYPTTLQTDPSRVGSDLTGTLGLLIGNVEKFAVEQFLLRNDHVESPGPFKEEGLHELDEHAVVNSLFMTGVANTIAPDRFKSKLSDKTIVRFDYPIQQNTRIYSGSSINYFSVHSGTFTLKQEERTFATTLNPPAATAGLPFTPYGFHYLPGVSGNSYSDGYGYFRRAESGIKSVTTFAGDGLTDIGTSISASVMTPTHAASRDQLIYLSSTLAHPFLLEKIVIEMPFAAGPGWMNDAFRYNHIFNSDLDYGGDVGGPMITIGLMRQDGAGSSHRDLIASATITNAFDMTPGYRIASSTYSGGGGISEIAVLPRGVASMNVNPTVVINGPVLSGSNNFFTGTLKFTLEPSITSHVLRTRLSGSNNFFWSSLDNSSMAQGMLYGPCARRSSRYIGAGRDILGNQFALLKPDEVNGDNFSVYSFDSSHELSGSRYVAPNKVYRYKIYHDVKSKSTTSPYLLYPEDRLTLCLSKHKPVASAAPNFVNNEVGDISYEYDTQHDISIPSGLLRITLYGDLIKNDVEFHDTLNQRLETEELWETIGEDPVLDQFDVTYASELSGTYLDRFNVLNTISSINFQTLSSSIETTRYFSNFGLGQTAQWSSQYDWSNTRSVEELKKANRNANHFGSEKFWDTRIPDPYEVMHFINPNLRLEGQDISAPDGSIYSMNNILYTGTQVASGANEPSISLTGDRGIRDWMMTYPYEAKFSDLSKVFADTILNAQRTFKAKFAGGGGSTTAIPVHRYLGELNFVLGDDTAGTTLATRHRRIAGEMSSGVTPSEFIKIFYGIGDGRSKIDNQHVKFYDTRDGGGTYQGVCMRGWRYGMMNAFPMRSMATFRRDRFGQARDMLEQRLDAKFYVSDETFVNNIYTTAGVKEGPVQVRFYDRSGNPTDPLLTLSSNLSFEATSSLPYSDGNTRNRSDSLDYSTLNISSVTL